MGIAPPGGQIWNQLMAQIKPSPELHKWSKDEAGSFTHLDFTEFLKNLIFGSKMVKKRFFDHISGTKPPRDIKFALLGSSYRVFFERSKFFHQFQYWYKYF